VGLGGLGDKWGHGAGTWGGFRGTSMVDYIRGLTWRHGAGTWGGLRGQVGTRGWEMGWA